MKKKYLIPVLALLVSACSYTILLPPTPASPAPAVSLTDTLFMTSTSTPTITPTQPTPTFTSTPTFIYSGPTPTSSGTALPTGTIGYLVATATAVSSQLQLGSQSPVFDSIVISGNHLVWGTSCQANSIKVSTHVASEYTATVKSVLLFTRLKDSASDTTTDWNNGAIMDSGGDGAFTYQLSATVIKYYRDFTSAWVQYQLVATNAKQQVVGRTQLFLNNISITQCP